MNAKDHQQKCATSFQIDWSSSNVWSNLPVNGTTALPSAAVGNSNSNLHNTLEEHGRPFSPKVLPSRSKLRSYATTKLSPLGQDHLAEKKLRDVVQQCKKDTLFELINQGVSVCSADSKKRTPLHFAAAQGNDEILQILLENGANPNARDLNGNTPLHLAACTNQLKIVTLLLQAGANVIAADFNGKTPLDLAYSRLRVLHGDQKIRDRPSVYCEEVKQVIELIRAYMLRLGNKTAGETLDNISGMLGKSVTTEEVDEVHGLLASFTAMNLSQHGDKVS